MAIFFGPNANILFLFVPAHRSTIKINTKNTAEKKCQSSTYSSLQEI